MNRSIFLSTLILVSLLSFPAHSGNKEETKARLSVVSRECAERADKILSDDTWSRHWVIRSDCRRISSLRDDLTRCATERNRLRIAAGCSHKWEDTGPGRRWCRECRSIAHFLGGVWMVTFTGGLWVGPDPLRYPKEYGLE